ncbi:MAG TPA: Sir2 family NAD-dependent protein deacetylase [Hyphomicrobiales bacterium]|nr:Sir2 family NAD-dependent protein deacetylase [Hyphomicrobiales bacterium]
MESAVDRLATMLRAAEHAVVLTGAGVSTDSGIPDFRSPTGLWRRQRPISYQEFLASPERRAEAWRNKFALDDAHGGARPNPIHHAIAGLVAAGRIALVVTQNIDGLHGASGIPDERLVELHGNGTYAKCLSCGERYTLDWVRERFASSGVAPDCPRCGGPIKSATIAFGQALPETALARAVAAAEDCDLFLALGTSLVVYPAAALPAMAKRRGATLAIVNREPTPVDDLADLSIHAELAAVFSTLVKEL